MKLNLNKDFCIVDLETTGLSIKKDRIIQIAILKIFADGRENELKKYLVNPLIPIPPTVEKLTGITNEMVKDKPIFKQYSKGILQYISDCDLCGFNSNRFDFPLLFESLYREGLEFDLTGVRFVDVKRIFHKLEERTLSAAYKFYCGKELEAHDAGNDVIGTFEVLESMLDYYKDRDYIDSHNENKLIEKPVKNDIQALYEFTKNFDEIDFAGTMKWDENKIAIFNFGKYQGKPVAESLVNDPKYYDWIMNKGEFAIDTRRAMDKIILEYKQKQNIKV